MISKMPPNGQRKNLALYCLIKIDLITQNHNLPTFTVICLLSRSSFVVISVWNCFNRNVQEEQVLLWLPYNGDVVIGYTAYNG